MDKKAKSTKRVELRWVKATERPPSHKNAICLKIIEGGFREMYTEGRLRIDGTYHDLHNDTFYPADQIEWLEETEDLSAPASPVEEKPEVVIAFANWINNSWYTPHYGKWIHLRHGLDGLKTTEELYEMYKKSPSPVIEIGEQKGEIPEEVIDWIDAWKKKNIVSAPEDWQVHSLKTVWAAAIALDLYRYLAPKISQPSHPAPALIVGEREERKYPIGGYAPGNYHCNCVTCKQHFKGDKRAVQCEPCAIKAEDSAPTDQALPEEVEQWVKNWIDTNIPPIAFPEYNSQLATRQKAAEAIAIALYHKMQEDLRAATIIHEQTGNALQAQIAEAKETLRIATQNETSCRVWLEKSREALTSARTLILDIKNGNIYQEPADECGKWLTDNIETK